MSLVLQICGNCIGVAPRALVSMLFICKIWPCLSGLPSLYPNDCNRAGISSIFVGYINHTNNHLDLTVNILPGFLCSCLLCFAGYPPLSFFSQLLPFPWKKKKNGKKQFHQSKQTPHELLGLKNMSFVQTDEK